MNKWLAPKIYYQPNGEFGVGKGWRLMSPYLRHKYILFGPRQSAMAAIIEDFETKYVTELTGWRAALVRLFGSLLVEHPRYELWRFNWTVYRLLPN